MPNPFQMMIMQSQMNLELVLKDLSRADGDPMEALNQILEARSLDAADFTDSDLKTLEKKVNSMYRQY